MKYQIAPMWFSKDLEKDKVFLTKQDYKVFDLGEAIATMIPSRMFQSRKQDYKVGDSSQH